MTHSSAIFLIATEEQDQCSKFIYLFFVIIISLLVPHVALGWSMLREAFPVLGCCNLRPAYHTRALLARKPDEMRVDTCPCSNVFGLSPWVRNSLWYLNMSFPQFAILSGELVNLSTPSTQRTNTTLLVLFSEVDRKILGIWKLNKKALDKKGQKLWECHHSSY